VEDCTAEALAGGPRHRGTAVTGGKAAARRRDHWYACLASMARLLAEPRPSLADTGSLWAALRRCCGNWLALWAALRRCWRTTGTPVAGPRTPGPVDLGRTRVASSSAPSGVLSENRRRLCGSRLHHRWPHRKRRIPNTETRPTATAGRVRLAWRAIPLASSGWDWDWRLSYVAGASFSTCCRSCLHLTRCSELRTSGGRTTCMGDRDQSLDCGPGLRGIQFASTTVAPSAQLDRGIGLQAGVAVRNRPGALRRYRGARPA